MDVVVPDLGDFADVEIIEILVKPGDEVAAEQGLITLETEKATMDVPSPAAGRVDALKVKVGDRVSKGDVILSLATNGAGAGPDARAVPDARAAGDTTVRQPKKVRPPEDKTVRQRKVARAPQDKTVRRPQPLREAAPQTIVVPDLGDFANVEVIDVLVKPGDEVAAEQGLVTLETEKASMDVPAPLAGTVLELKVAVGARVSAGDPVLVLRPSAAGSTTPARPTAAPTATPTATAAAPVPAAAAAAAQASPARRSTPPPASVPRVAVPSASSRASSASIFPACAAPVTRGASRPTT